MGSGAQEEAPDAVGSVGEEAVKLVGALTDWARDHAPALEHGLHDLVDQAATAARDLSEAVEPVEHGSPECAWCPICRTAHVIRTPEVRDHLVAAAGSLLQAASALVAGATAGPRPADQPGVEHIDLDGEWPEDR